MRKTISKGIKPDIEDLSLKIREFTDDFGATKSRVYTMEDNLPKMIREMISFYVDQKFEKRFDLFVTKDVLKSQLATKMDYTVFKDFQRHEADAAMSDMTVFKNNERFISLEKQLKGFVYTSNLNSALKKTVKTDLFSDLESIVSKLKKSTEESQEVINKKYK